MSLAAAAAAAFSFHVQQRTKGCQWNLLVLSYALLSRGSLSLIPLFRILLDFNGRYTLLNSEIVMYRYI